MDETPKLEPKKNTGMAVIAYILFFVPLLSNAKNDSFVKYHVKQGLVLLIASLVVSFISWLPIIIWFAWILRLGILALFIIGVLNALNGKEKPLPLIGQFAEQFKF